MTTQTNTTLVKEAKKRVWATLHQINGHWWNKRQRPDARDLVTILASLPTDDDDTVERVARAICEDGAVPNSWASRSEHQRNCYRKDARAAIHTLIGRGP